MKRTTQIAWALALGLVIVNVAAADTWTRKADMPTARYCFAASEVNGKIYAIGGWDAWLDPTPLATVEMYDPATDTWERKADMPTPRGALATAVLDGKIYAIGGACGQSPTINLSTVEVYDPVTDTWEEGVSMSTGTCFHSAVVLEGRIYTIGGYSDTMRDGSYIMEEFDPNTNNWSGKASMPTVRMAFGTGVVNGRIYVIGGDAGQGDTASVLEYDPITDSWTQKANMPTARGGLLAAVVDEKIYAIGGGYYGSPSIATVEVYDHVTDTWESQVNMPIANSSFGVGVVNERIYTFGGNPINGGQGMTGRSFTTVYEYDPNPLVVDFNGDFMVDIADLLLLIEHWGGSDPAFDIAPWPSPDGIIDVLDLEILMNSWGQELADPSLLAHWKLDEAEGAVAADNAGTCDGTLVGDPLWQPTGGKKCGALLLDGIDDRVVTEFVRDPAEGPFSLFAWIKGGAPGQTIVSQANGANWLTADPAQGLLMTELKGAGRLSRALCSQTMITDDAWHRLGLVWDGSHRILYVDDIEVTRDAQSSLAGTYAGLHIGAGKALEPGSFFDGLIDDVRLYNRAIVP